MANPRAIIMAAKAMPGGGRPTSSPQTPGAPNYGRSNSSLAQQIMASDGSWGAAYGNFLPRPPASFTQGAFGPMPPILPVPVDQPPDGAERAEPRRFEYEVGYNLPNGVPGSEGYKLAPFSALKTLSELYSVARACVQLRKSEIRGLDWDIVPTQAATKAYQGDRDAMRDFGERVAKAKKFFRHPDPDYFSFSSWLDAMLEQVFVYDALTLLIRPTWGKGMGKGILGTDLDSLMLVNGASIRPLLDLHGSTPRPPAPAYQQFLFGVPRSDYVTMMTNRDIEEGGLSEQDFKLYRGDQMLYLPMVKRVDTPYGFPPIERALIPVMSGLQKQAFQLDWFREGCYSDDTEILTKDGWKLFTKLEGTEEVATRSTDGEFQWQKPSAYLSYPYDGELIEYSNKSIDLRVTPGHRMLVRRPEFYARKHPNGEGQDWHIQLAKHLADKPASWWEVPATSHWNGVDPGEYKFSIGPSKANSARNISISSDDFATFIGLYISEGWVRKDRNDVYISQRSYSKHIEDIRIILKATGFHWNYDEKNQRFCASSKELADWLRHNIPGRAWEKCIPQELKESTQSTLKCLLRGLMMGDGNIGVYDQRYYTTTSKRLADDVQEVFQKIGVDAWVRPTRMEKYNSGEYGPGGFGTFGHRRQQYVVRERLQQTHMLPKPKFTEYHGTVHCVTVPNGIVYVRRNGRAVWCGNTVPAVYISPGDVNMTPNQIRDLQDALNAFAGDPAWKHKIIVLPPGSKIDPQKPSDLADQFDEVVMSQVAMAFDVNPMELGIMPQVSSVTSPFAAREMAQSQRSIHERVSTKPTLKFLTDLFDNILHRVLGQDDMHFTFEGLQQEAQANALTDMLVKQVQYGIRSVDEARDELELPPWGTPETSGPVVFTGAGPMPFGPVAPAPGGQSGGTPGMLPSGQEENTADGAAQARQQIMQSRPGPAPGQAQSSITPGHEAASAEVREPSVRPTPTGRQESPRARTRAEIPDLTKAINAELEALVRHLRKGRKPDTWRTAHIPEFVPVVVANQIAMGESPEQIIKAVSDVIILDNQDYHWIDSTA